MSVAARQSIGIDIGGTNLRLGVFAGNDLLEELRFDADFSGLCKQHPADVAWQKILMITAEAIQTVLAKYPQVQAIGVGFPGFIDPVSGIIESSPNLPGLKNIHLAKDLSATIHRLVGGSLPVAVVNDANAAAFGEYNLLDKPASGLLYFGLGTGVGGGLILNDQPYAGHHGCAMEVGHIIVHPNGRQCGCGNQGCMEQYASASGVAISYFEKTQQQLSAFEIAKLADAGDDNALHAYTIAAQALAQALASILKVVDVQNVVIGGGMAAAWHLMEAPFNTKLNEDLMPVLRNKAVVQVSEAGDIAGMLGAAMRALQS